MTAAVRRSRSDEGLTLIEVLVTVVILGIAFVTVVGGMAVSIAGSDMHRKQATSQTVLRNLAEFLKAAPYNATCPANYTDALLDFTGTTYAPHVIRLASSPTKTPVGDGDVAFISADNAKIIGERPTPLNATAELTPSTTASVRLIFPPQASSTATIKGALLRVSHREEGGQNDLDKLSLAVTVTPEGGPSFTPPPLLIRDTTTDESIDLLALGLTSAQITSRITVDFSATLGAASAATEHLDGVEIGIALQSPPMVEPADYIVAINQPVEMWNGVNPAAFDYSEAPCSDAGLQRLTLRVRSVDRQGLPPEELVVVKRMP